MSALNGATLDSLAFLGDSYHTLSKVKNLDMVAEQADLSIGAYRFAEFFKGKLAFL